MDASTAGSFAKSKDKSDCQAQEGLFQLALHCCVTGQRDPPDRKEKEMSVLLHSFYSCTVLFVSSFRCFFFPLVGGGDSNNEFSTQNGCLVKKASRRDKI